MANPSGHIAGDMKWFVYRYPQKPKTLMALGSILTQPDDLESSLNYETGIRLFLANEKWDQTDVVQRIIHAELSKEFAGRLKALLPAVSPVASIGGGVEGNLSDTSEATLQALDIRAEVVKRDAAKDHINEALQTPEVSQYVRRGLYAKPLYMIIGVASCKKLLMSDTRSQEKGFSADVDASTAVIGAEAGAGLSTSTKTSSGADLEVQEQCDFAYRVRKFQYSRFRREIKKATDLTDGALFGGESDKEVPLTNAEAEAMDDEVAVFDEFETEDVEIESDGGVDFFRLRV